MSVRMRHTREHTAKRRSHHALKEPRLCRCSNCNQYKKRHTVCLNCGFYRGRKLIDVLAKLDKKEKKKKEKELSNQNVPTAGK